jgi:hypothetical protein
MTGGITSGVAVAGPPGAEQAVKSKLRPKSARRNLYLMISNSMVNYRYFPKVERLSHRYFVIY